VAVPVRVFWTRPAIADLQSIREYIAADGRPMAARRLAKRIRDRVELLALHPLAGRQLPELPGAPYREVIVGPFRIVYQVSGDRLEVLRVWHSSRDLAAHFEAL
jgi:plasmid stabilization system protein ParE